MSFKSRGGFYLQFKGKLFDHHLKGTNPGQPVAYPPPPNGHRGSVYFNRSYEKAEAREDLAHKVEKNLGKNLVDLSFPGDYCD